MTGAAEGLRSEPEDLRLRAEAVWRELQADLLERRNAAGHWRGRLSSSALSTAIASFALTLVVRERPDHPRAEELRRLARAGRLWLARHANPDGGWGDTVRSRSNLPTTLLSWTALRAADEDEGEVGAATRAAGAWIEARAGGLDPGTLKATVEKLYGEDKTFSVPILAMTALGGVLGPEPAAWKGPPSLPFEVAVLPHAFFRFVGLPVVSYALPALIAVGQVQHVRGGAGPAPLRWLRNRAREATLRRLLAIQPESGGFLEAIPLTGFVTLSLVGCGEVDHPVVERAVEFLGRAVRQDEESSDDAAWPIDVDLATWVSTLAVQGLVSRGVDGEALGAADRDRLVRWLLDQQYRDVHPFTNAAPGGWAWTDLPGGVPDADDTPGALLALDRLVPSTAEEELLDEVHAAVCAALGWLLDLQNRDGGLPTFCRGWGKLPFDRSSPDLTAHAVRAFLVWGDRLGWEACPPGLRRRLDRGLHRALSYLEREQRDNGSWVPLWFGHEAAPELENPVFGTSRVLRALAEVQRRGIGRPALDAAVGRGRSFLVGVQDAGGGWGGHEGIEPSVEETALAVEALNGLGLAEDEAVISAGIDWLCRRWHEERFRTASPIGFYFANLWYFEDLYPLVFAAGALGEWLRQRGSRTPS